MNRPTYNEALKRYGAPTISFDPEMRLEGVPTGKRSRRQRSSDALIQS